MWRQREPLDRCGTSQWMRVDIEPATTKELDVFYVKNVPNWERAIRLIMGVLALVYAASSWGSSSRAVGAGVVGAMTAMTGLIGFCPMCAMAGRKLDKGH